MTEAEAMKCWCPLVRISIREDGNYKEVWAQTNRGEDATCATATTCIASACMAWRNSPTAEFTRRADKLYRDEGKRLTPGPEDVDGHCGLAGSPS